MTLAHSDGIPTLDDLAAKAETLIQQARLAGVMIATAESCTAGLISASLTEVAGSSAVFDRGFVTYSNEAKSEMLGVPAELIERHGAVSPEVAMAMAEGALARSNADRAISVTGIAGPGGGTPGKPVGTVHFGVAATGQPVQHHHIAFADNGRRAVRLQTAARAIEFLSIALTPSTKG